MFLLWSCPISPGLAPGCTHCGGLYWDLFVVTSSCCKISHAFRSCLLTACGVEPARDPPPKRLGLAHQTSICAVLPKKKCTWETFACVCAYNYPSTMSHGQKHVRNRTSKMLSGRFYLPLCAYVCEIASACIDMVMSSETLPWIRSGILFNFLNVIS